MNVKWIIEDVFVQDDVKCLIKALDDNNTEYAVSTRDSILKHYQSQGNECIVPYGSLNFIRFIKKNTNWIPGVWIDFEALKQHNYLPILNQYTIHQKYGFYPLGDLNRMKNFLFKTYMSDNSLLPNSIFIKPDNTTKEFSGQVVDYFDYDDFLIRNCLPLNNPSLLCLVSQPVFGIACEYRFFCFMGHNGSGIITYTKYSEDQKNKIVDVDTKELEIFVKEIVSVYWMKGCNQFINSMQHCFTVDVAILYNGDFKLIEIGGFNASGIYNSDYDKLVKKINEMALNEWKEYNPKILL